MNDPRRYVVIGGGLAGLASAVWLAEAGKQVTLLERRGRLGGRTHAMKVEAADDLPDNRHRRGLRPTVDDRAQHRPGLAVLPDHQRGVRADTQTNEQIIDEQMRLLCRYYPAAANAKVVQGHVVRMPKATFSQVLGTHGLRADQRTSVPTLVLAGDWTATDWSATMESAVHSAAKAVELLLALPSSP